MESLIELQRNSSKFRDFILNANNPSEDIIMQNNKFYLELRENFNLFQILNQIKKAKSINSQISRRLTILTINRVISL